jgi:hypothetical protein
MRKQRKARRAEQRASVSGTELKRKDDAKRSGDASLAQDLQQQKLAAELEKLREEVRHLREERRWPWLLRVVLPAVLISLGTGAAGYLFGDSLEARSRAETRKDVLKAYFAVDNNVPGKRRQMLTFIKRNLAKGDPELQQWVRTEESVVEKRIADAQRELTHVTGELERLRARGKDRQAGSGSLAAEEQLQVRADSLRETTSEWW